MATEIYDVIEGDGSSDQVTLTDDPVENATVQAVKDAIGDETTASEERDAGVAATQIQRLTAVVSVLMDVLAGGDASDRLRVGIQEQDGDLTVTLDGEDVSIDQLPSLPAGGNNIGSVDIDSESADLSSESTLSALKAAIGSEGNASETDHTVSATAIALLKGTVELLGGTLTVTDDGGLSISSLPSIPAGDNNIGSVDLDKDNVGFAKESSLSNVDTAQGAKGDTSETDHTAFASEIALLKGLVELLGGTLTVTDDGALNVNSLPSVTLGTDTIGLAKETTLSDVDAAIGSQSDASETNTANSGSVVAFIQGVIDTLNATLTVTDDGALAIDSLPPIPAGGNNIGSVDLDSQTAGIAEESTQSSIEAAIGDEATASQEADSGASATLIERVTALVDALTSGQADDEVRVALASDLLSGDLDVNLNAQNGNVDVTLSGDSLTANLDVDLAEVSAAPLDVSAAEVDVDLNAQSLARLTSKLELSDGSSFGEVQRKGSDLRTAIQQWNAGVLGIQEDSALDVSAATVSVQEASALDVSGATVTVVDSGSFTLAANDGTDIGDVGIEDISAVTGQQSKSDSLPVTLASDEDTVHAEGDTGHDETDSGNPVKVGGVYAPSQADVEEGDRTDLRSTEKGDVSIAPLHHGDDSVEARLPTLEDATTATGAPDAAEIRATGGRTQVSVAWDTSGASTITVEVSSDGSTWFDRTHDVIPSQPGSAEQRAETLKTGFRHVRVYADSSLNELLISAKGL